TLAFAALDAASLALPGAALHADEEMWRSTYARLPAATPPRAARLTAPAPTGTPAPAAPPARTAGSAPPGPRRPGAPGNAGP
ncbi:TetR/AcrR family transcriptional regulator, partial [Streptomyces coelicoflavus]